MKQDVLISIKGIYRSEDDQDVVEIFTTGQYYQEDRDFYICYEESEATGFEGSSTTLRVEPEGRVTMRRTGAAESHLIVERGVRHQCQYDAGYGNMMIGICGSGMKSTLSETGGNLWLKYSLDVNSMHASENEMYVSVNTQGGPAAAQ